MHGRCKEPGCLRRATFGKKDLRIPEFCARHRSGDYCFNFHKRVESGKAKCKDSLQVCHIGLLQYTNDSSVVPFNTSLVQANSSLLQYDTAVGYANTSVMHAKTSVGQDDTFKH